MMKIKLAESTQLSAVYRFYREICEALKGAEYSSLWVYGARPSEESLKQAVEQNNLYLGWQGRALPRPWYWKKARRAGRCTCWLCSRRSAGRTLAVRC